MRIPLLCLLFLAGCVPSGYSSGRRSTFQRGAFVMQLPAPTYAPAGAGAPTLGQPGAYRPPELPPSPNKRILPPTKEPGIWAADSNPQVKVPKWARSPETPSAFGVEFPAPMGTPGRYIEKECAEHIRIILAGLPDLAHQVDGLSPEEKACLLARLYRGCVEPFEQSNLALIRDQQAVDEIVAGASARSKAFKEAKCSERADSGAVGILAHSFRKAWPYFTPSEE